MAEKTVVEAIKFLEKCLKDKGLNISKIILFGSQAKGESTEESDIDIFLVSEYPSQNIFNGWLDIYSLERKEFACALHSFDVSVLEPLFGGEIILGDLEYIKSLQNEVKKQKITRKAIEYNLRKIKEQKEATSIVQTEREQRVAVSYAETYRKTAELLAQGKRVLGRADLDII